MNKLLLFLLLTSSLYSEAKIYMGVGAGVYHENFSDVDAVSSSAIASFKLGYGNREAYAVEFSIDYAHNRSKIFSTSEQVTRDGNKYGFNVNLIKSFDWDIYILPFIKVGFGSGFLDIDRELQKNLTYGTFDLVVGTYLPMGKHFDLELGYEMRTTSYEAINTIVKKTSYNSLSNIAYMGINYRF
ncbi:MAG: outer membrane beta-barrel protein [Sulfurimonas sp.]|nr:outer membrane beta-barrel protein [Sulfurimonas sp.]